MVKLFTTHCPKCNVLEKKLRAKNVPFETIEDISEIVERGFTEAPILLVENNYMDFVSANAWVNGQ